MQLSNQFGLCALLRPLLVFAALLKSLFSFSGVVQGQEFHVFNIHEVITPTLPEVKLTEDQSARLLRKALQIADPTSEVLGLPKIRASLLRSLPTLADVEIAMIADMEGDERTWKNIRPGFIDGSIALDGTIKKGALEARPEVRVIAGG